jgi:type II secretory ATPase GspE/PulE/Tfp pilus assembly ATPase PilB-like protein
VDVRISSVPSTYGETVALRLLRRDPALLDLKALGFSPPLIELFEHVLGLRRGLFLVTGPTGSGKTTTLYAMLERLRGHALKMLSIEDPVEYFFSDITQVQVNEEAGVTFANALRSFLRQDPDVILVGEIRDSETAKIAIQAALTGHLVLATLHTADAPSAIPRLVDMGVDRYLVAATLAGAASQRLIRRLCADCRALRTASDLERAILADHASARMVAEPVGCNECRNTGYRGRIAVGEGFRVTDVLRQAALDPSGAALSAALTQASYAPFMAEAARLVGCGDVSLADFRALGVA